MYKAFDLNGHVALITGGNGGIGLGMAEALAQAGADIVIWGTNAEKNATAKTKLENYGRRVHAQIVDVGDEKAVIDGMLEAVATMGRIDSCFANAGISKYENSFLDIGGDAYHRIMRVNLDGAIFTMREACRHMKARAEAGDAGGSIVGVSSMAANFGVAKNEHYGASKIGVIGAVNGIAVEFARYGIRANSLLPGWAESELTSGLVVDDNFNKKAIGRVPLRRWGQPADFGGIAIYLASPASAFHTGDAILIDGGYSVY